MKWVLLVVTIMFVGCAQKDVRYVDRPVEVKVPVRCEIPLPEKPIVSVDAQGLKNVLMYTETLECLTFFCGTVAKMKPSALTSGEKWRQAQRHGLIRKYVVYSRSLKVSIV